MLFQLPRKYFLACTFLLQLLATVNSSWQLVNKLAPATSSRLKGAGGGRVEGKVGGKLEGKAGGKGGCSAGCMLTIKPVNMIAT